MFSYKNEGDHFQIWNSSGVQMMAGLTKTGDNTIDMSRFPAGLYFISVSADTGARLLGKFIIQP